MGKLGVQIEGQGREDSGPWAPQGLAEPWAAGSSRESWLSNPFFFFFFPKIEDKFMVNFSSMNKDKVSETAQCLQIAVRRHILQC